MHQLRLVINRIVKSHVSITQHVSRISQPVDVKLGGNPELSQI